ncbi:rRNA-processing protein cgr1 [Savitreella phatthalungensis]
MIRVGGKSWKSQKTATKRSNLSASRKTPYEQRRAAAQLAKEIKQQEEEMKEERQQELEHRKKKIQERRQKKAEKERFELLQAKMHQKSVDRIKRRAKKSKLING